VSTQLREAASVILLRNASPGFEVFLLRRRKGASFMASAFVFPGGGAEENEDARTCAARELFEEAGVLLARDDRQGESDTLSEGAPIVSSGVLRKKVLAGQHATEVITKVGLAWRTDVLVPWSHWITPSLEPRRFSARFFVCEMPLGQVPTFDNIETVDQVWVRPADAIQRAKDLALPPPQLRTMHELAELPTIEDVLAAGHTRSFEPHPILPRVREPADGGITLLLPWDPEYTVAGSGDAAPLTYKPGWARGPSRFVREDQAWKHIAAPGSTRAG
jgi:8-oxo-dGTP pyrophosphatase MutT (NUDIX family)